MTNLAEGLRATASTPADGGSIRPARLQKGAVRAMVAYQRKARRVLVSDTTLRDGEQMPRVAFSPEDKARIACALERAGVHSIDAGFAAAGPQELEAIRAVAAAVDRPVVMSLARTLPVDIDRAAEALEGRAATKRGVSLFVGTSPLHRKHKLACDKNDLLALINDSVRYAARFFDIIAFSAEDATRTEVDFLCACFQVAIEAGATSVALPDTVGLLLPDMAADLVRKVQEGVPNIDQTLLAVHFHDDLGLAVANSLAAVQAGAQIVQCTVGGIGERAGNAALEEVALALVLHSDALGRQTACDTRQLLELCRLVSELSGVPIAPNKAIVGANIFATEAGVHQDGLIKDARTYQAFPPELVGAEPGFRLIIGKHSGRRALACRLAALGIELDAHDLDTLLGHIKSLRQPSDADDDRVLRELANAIRSMPPAGQMED